MRHSPLRTRIRVAIATTIAAAVLPAFADVPITAVPPADFRPPAVEKSAPALLLAPSAPAWRIALPEPTPAERAVLAARNAPSSVHGATAGKLKGPLALAFPRDVPAGFSSIALDRLDWHVLGDGSRAARIEVVSPGAAALRVALQLSSVDPGVEARFSGNGEHAQVFGPIPANKIASDTERFGLFWSPVLEGDVATIEIHVDAGVRVPNVPIAVAKISHQVVAPGSIGKLTAKAVQDIGRADSCEIDVACVTPQSSAFVDSRKAVAAIEFTQEDGVTYLCTGQLLNDSLSSNTPYFFSAQHCLDSQMAASTLDTFWFFDAVSLREQDDAAVRASVGRRGDARAKRRLGLVAGASQHAAAGGYQVFGVARRADSDTHRDIGAAPSGRRPQEMEPGRVAGLPALRRWLELRAGAIQRGHDGAGLERCGSADVFQRRRAITKYAADCGAVRHPARNPQGIDEYSRIDNMLPLTRQYLTPTRRAPRDRPSRSSTTIARSIITSSRSAPPKSTTSTPACMRAGNAPACAFSRTRARRRARIPCAGFIGRRASVIRTSIRRVLRSVRP